MKYIKQFNHLILESFTTDLKEFCELNLAYLLDDDYTITVKDRKDGNSYVRFGNKLVDDVFHNQLGFSWNSIKDQFIPFLQRLSKTYNVYDEILFNLKDLEKGDDMLYRYTFDDRRIKLSTVCYGNESLPDELFGNRFISSISILVKEE